MTRRLRFLWLLTTLCVAAAGVLTPRAALAAPAQPQEYVYAECSRADAATIEAEITTIAHAILTEAESHLAIDALVARKWTEVGAGPVLDAAVDRAIAQVQAEESYWERFLSGWSPDKAQELAARVAEVAFADPALAAKLDELSTVLAAALVSEMETYAARSASSALLCLQSYVGGQYSETLYSAFAQNLEAQLGTELDLDEASDVTVAPLALHTKSMAGVGVLLTTEITRRLAQAMSKQLLQRMAGKIAGRVLGRIGSSAVPYVGWAIGIGLIAWDLWEGGKGALPQIRDALQAEEVKQEVQAEIVAAVREGLSAESSTMAAGLAATLLGQWQGFCATNRDLCTLAANNRSFALLLDTTPVTQLDALAQQVNFFLSTLGAEALTVALRDGTFEALLALPHEAKTILAWTRSPATTLDWANLAGDSLADVVAYQIYRVIDPVALDKLSLAAIVAIGDNEQIHKLLNLAPAQRETLLALPTTDLKAILAQATADELTWLAAYAATLPPDAAAALYADLAAGTTTVAQLRQPPVVAAEPTEGATPASAGAAVTQTEWWAQAWTAIDKVFDEVVGDNGVLPAALLVVIALVAVGAVLSMRRDPLDGGDAAD